MPTPSIGRIIQVTAALSALGVVVGGLIGGVLIAVPLGIPLAEFSITDQALLMGMMFGAVMGGVLAPIAAWTLMRRVPIWRAITETSIGTLVGALLGFIFQSRYDSAWLSPVFLGVAGFAVAAVRLRFSTRARSAAE